jgi:hypothetical protein
MPHTTDPIPDAFSRAEALAQRCEHATPTATGWRACCPAHEDTTPSLAIDPGDDKILLHCFAGCTAEDILHALGLTMADLFCNAPAHHNGNGQKHITHTYDYYDAQGTLLFQTVRYDHPKDFRQRRPDPVNAGQWIWDLKTIAPVLYNLPAVLQAVQAGIRIYICEGEKDADALITRNLVATTCPMGAGKWRKPHSETLHGAHVAILPDNDPPGQKHALQIAAALQGLAASIVIVRGLHTDAAGSDVSDWLAAGGTQEAFDAAVQAAGAAPALPPLGWPTGGGLPAVVAVAREPWRDELMTKKNGEPLQNVGNMGLLLHHHPFWQREDNAFWWDSVRGTPMMGRAEIDDDTITTIAEWLGTVERMSVTQLKLLERCVLKQCRLAPKDLLQIWLNTLPPWDTTPRLDTWLQQITGIPDRPYVQGISKMLLLSMVARAMQPGCLYRYVVILEGPEEAGKSTLVRALATANWHVELSVGLESKESHMMLQGAWVAEMAELDSLSRTEDTRLKAFITQRNDSYIPKFSNFRASTPRRCIFVGTTNEESYLKGQSGNTRYMPIYIGTSIDVDTFEAIRDQLFAEALTVYQSDPVGWWRLPDAVLSAAVDEREKRRLANEYEQPLHDWLTMGRFDTPCYADEWGTDRFGNMTRTRGPQVTFVPGETSWPEIARWFLRIETPERWKDKALQMQIAAALKALHWKNVQVWQNNRNTKVWQYQPSHTEEVPF